MGRRPCGSEVNRGPYGSGVNRENHEVLRGKEEDHVVLKERREDHVVLECFFLPHGLGSRRDFAAIEKGRKDFCWWAMRRCHMALD